MNREQRIAAFDKLGRFMSQFKTTAPEKKDDIEFNDLFFEGMKHQIALAFEHNGWFTSENIAYAFEGWSELLKKDELHKWLSAYRENNQENSKKIAVIMAGNIPLVGFHDCLAVLISGHRAIIKQSSQDRYLMPFLIQYLCHVEPGFKGKIEFTDKKLEDYDAVIATGSNNTARYFDYYFRNRPSVIRRNRNSVAVLKGKETDEQLTGLAEDIFRYFGLGCRSVSKIFIPAGYNFDRLFNSIYPWHSIINYPKYSNNYDYNKAVYLMSEFDMLENGFLMVKEDDSYASPIATLFYEYYDNEESLRKKLHVDKDQIQCVVANGFSDDEIPFGKTQRPGLADYADGVDTVDFLLKI